jgi:hypothetical protein
VTWRTLMDCSVFYSLKANLLAEKYRRGASYPPASRLMRGQTFENPRARSSRISLLGRAREAPTGGGLGTPVSGCSYPGTSPLQHDHRGDGAI